MNILTVKSGWLWRTYTNNTEIFRISTVKLHNSNTTLFQGFTRLNLNIFNNQLGSG